jgi:hypothetical protein
MKIRNNKKTLLTFDLPTGSLHLPGRQVSRNLTDEEFASPQVQKAKKYRWIREVREKTPATAPVSAKAAEPVASPVRSVAGTEPNDSSDDQ